MTLPPATPPLEPENDQEQRKPELTSRERKKLRGLGHHLEAAVYIGREGLTQPVIAAAEESLLAHELIKVKLGQNCPLSRQEAAERLAAETGALLVQVIGRMVLLYQANPKLARERRLAL
jgi:RNA-binding protein